MKERSIIKEKVLPQNHREIMREERPNFRRKSTSRKKSMIRTKNRKIKSLRMRLR